MSRSKRLTLGLRHSGKQGTQQARRRAYRAAESEVSKWIAHVSASNTGTLRTVQETYVKGKAYKSSLER